MDHLDSYFEGALYVGDLSKDVTEAMLLPMFSVFGPLKSFGVCRDLDTKESLGYAYVNFKSKDDAENALQALNYEPLNGKPMRIMWSDRDSTRRKSSEGNIIIKNLDKSIDSKTLFDTFSGFGSILSCKISTDENGISKGFGFIQFKTEEQAKNAIDSVNGMLMCDKEVFVGKFIPKSESLKSVFIKNFGESLDEDKLHEMFSKFGNISSHVIMRKEDGTSKGFGFVNFKEASDAEAAVLELNNSEIDGQIIFVGRALSKYEKERDLQSENPTFNERVNLYVKNLDHSIDDDFLRTLFSPYGTITSAKVMKSDDNRSKGFGFVCFSSHEEAIRAITDMNNRMVRNQLLYVGLAEKKEDRRAKLASQIMFQQGTSYNLPTYPHLERDFQAQIPIVLPFWSNETQTMDTAHAPAPMYPVTSHNIGQTAGSSSSFNLLRTFDSSVIRFQRPVLQAIPTGISNTVTTANTRPQNPHWLSQNIRSSLASSEVDTSSSRNLCFPETIAWPYLSTHQDDMVQYSFTEISIRPQPTRNEYIINEILSTDRATTSQHSANQDIEYLLSATQQATESQHLPTQQTTKSYPSEAVVPCTQETLTESILAKATLNERRIFLGERLYPHVKKLYPEVANEITRMLLEFDHNELLQLLEDPHLIKEKADDAFSVLKAQI